MLYNLIIQSSEVGQTIVYWIEFSSRVMEILAVIIIVFGIILSLFRYVWHRVKKEEELSPYKALKARLGYSMLLGLEILVAADIVRTVALDATLISVGILGLLVLVRTFLSWSLEVEIEGRWPWQSKRDIE